MVAGRYLLRPVAVVQHQASVPPGSVTNVLETSRVDHFVLEAWRRAEWPAVDDLGALIVLGGTMNVDDLDGFPLLRSSRALMAEALARDLPTLGVCLGAQMMARVLGKEVTRAQPRNAFFSDLELTVEGRNDPLLEPFASGVPVLQFHEDTFDVPGAASALATSVGSGLPQAFRYRDTGYAVQFHFEVNAAIVRRWIHDIGLEAFVERWRTSEEELLRQAEMHVEKQRLAGEEMVRRFLAIAKPVLSG